jgi:hypothetical protein
VLGKLSTDEASVTNTVKALGQILDPSISEASLGASLAGLAERAKSGAYATEVLPVEPDGTLSARTGDGMIKDVLGGTVNNSDPGASPRVALRDAGSASGASGKARVALVNGGYTVVGTADGETRATSQVLWAEEAQKQKAAEVARTLGLPDSAVRKGEGAGNADVTVVLGKDYDG